MFLCLLPRVSPCGGGQVLSKLSGSDLEVFGLDLEEHVVVGVLEDGSPLSVSSPWYRVEISVR